MFQVCKLVSEARFWNEYDEADGTAKRQLIGAKSQSSLILVMFVQPFISHFRFHFGIVLSWLTSRKSFHMSSSLRVDSPSAISHTTLPGINIFRLIVSAISQWTIQTCPSVERRNHNKKTRSVLQLQTKKMHTSGNKCLTRAVVVMQVMQRIFLRKKESRMWSNTIYDAIPFYDCRMQRNIFGNIIIDVHELIPSRSLQNY